MSTIIKAPVLKAVVDSLATMVDEAKINITETGFTVNAVNPANVAMVNLLLDKGAFEDYDLQEGAIAIDLTRLKETIKGISKEGLVQLNLNQETRKLELTNGAYCYKLSLLDPSSIRKEPKVPNLDLPGKIVLNGCLLKKAVTDGSKVSDHIRLTASKESFKMMAEGDLDSFTAEHPETELISITADRDVSSLFSLDYLKDIMKVLGESEKVTINLGTDYPAKFSMPLAGGCGTVTYLIAPRIESE
jgi:proliferating cell nuclear antigen